MWPRGGQPHLFRCVGPLIRFDRRRGRSVNQNGDPEALLSFNSIRYLIYHDIPQISFEVCLIPFSTFPLKVLPPCWICCSSEKWVRDIVSKGQAAVAKTRLFDARSDLQMVLLGAQFFFIAEELARSVCEAVSAQEPRVAACDVGLHPVSH